MILGLENFDIDMFLTFEDENIFIYSSDIETIPELAELIPLGSFDEEGKYKLINLAYPLRIEVGKLFMERDFYIYFNPENKNRYVTTEIFLREFKSVPEVMNFFKKYVDLCVDWGVQYTLSPPEWIGWHDDWYYTEHGINYIDWSTYPNWCSSASCYSADEFADVNWELYPEWCRDYPYVGVDVPTCFQCIPIEVIPQDDLYYMTLVYFNGIYRTNPESIQNFGIYTTLTDVDFELNKYSLMVDITLFFTVEFQRFLKTSPGSIPFACDYGNHIKYAVQTKNEDIRRIEIENELDFFILRFNALYGELVIVNHIDIVAQESNTGGDSWLVEVAATIKEDRLIYRIEI